MACFKIRISWFLIFFSGYIFGCFGRSFVIDYESNVFLKDGEVFRYISGDIHYFRIPRIYWKDRLMKMKAAGLNTVQIYIAWNVHERTRGEFNFKEEADIEVFINLVNSLDLLLIVRPGPYICAEWDLGGFPSWLLQNSSMVLRSSDEAYLASVTSWMNILLPKVKKYLYSNGGPIIAVQVENEYGSYYTCDHKYMTYLQSLFENLLGNDVILFTVDPVDFKADINCGSLSSLFTTVDFGPETNPKTAFETQRRYQPKGPLVNTEFYVGWIDNWGLPFERKNATLVAKALDTILAMNASVNIYMFEGGTNFGYNNGATWALLYLPVLTSYDYDAPLSESGDPNEKYFAIRHVISKYLPQPPGPVPPALPNCDPWSELCRMAAAWSPFDMPRHGHVDLRPSQFSRWLQIMSIWDAVKILPSSAPTFSKYPITAENLGQFYGFTIYTTTLKFKSGSKILHIPGVRDRALIFLNKIKQGVMDRNGLGQMGMDYNENDTLDILVENQGHINFLLLNDAKGIVQNVTLDNIVLTDWNISSLRLDPDDVQHILNISELVDHSSDSASSTSFYVGNIPAMPDGRPPIDTFLYLKDWSKGQAFINTFNIGRYWPVRGPQQALYVPANAFHTDAALSNKVMLFEIDNSPCFFSEQCYVEFIKEPILN